MSNLHLLPTLLILLLLWLPSISSLKAEAGEAVNPNKAPSPRHSTALLELIQHWGNESADDSHLEKILTRLQTDAILNRTLIYPTNKPTTPPQFNCTLGQVCRINLKSVLNVEHLNGGAMVAAESNTYGIFFNATADKSAIAGLPMRAGNISCILKYSDEAGQMKEVQFSVNVSKPSSHFNHQIAVTLQAPPMKTCKRSPWLCLELVETLAVSSGSSYSEITMDHVFFSGTELKFLYHNNTLSEDSCEIDKIRNMISMVVDMEKKEIKTKFALIGGDRRFIVKEISVSTFGKCEKKTATFKVFSKVEWNVLTTSIGGGFSLFMILAIVYNVILAFMDRYNQRKNQNQNAEKEMEMGLLPADQLENVEMAVVEEPIEIC